ncbi:MAG: peroxide stress protein YaaA [Rhodothalassiaceae bacterium]
MLVLLSPAKRLDGERPPVTDRYSQPRLLEQAQQLAQAGARLTPAQFQGLTGVSDRLADLNVQRFKAFSPPFDLNNARQAIFLFRGDVYQGLDADNLDEDALAFAQEHLRILSGLYGVLRPLDLIQPYRLEMGTRFQVNGAGSLYDFWGGQITDLLEQDLNGAAALVNLASNEYFKAVDEKRLTTRLITPVFTELRNGKPTQISFFAKKARGLMARFILVNRIEDPEGLKAFDDEGYRFRADLSQGHRWMFTRPDSRA